MVVGTHLALAIDLGPVLLALGALALGVLLYAVIDFLALEGRIGHKHLSATHLAQQKLPIAHPPTHLRLGAATAVVRFAVRLALGALGAVFGVRLTVIDGFRALQGGCSLFYAMGIGH